MRYLFIFLVIFMNACTILKTELIDTPELQNKAPEMDMQVFDLPEGKTQLAFGTFKTQPFLKAKPDSFSFVMTNVGYGSQVKTTCTLIRRNVDDWISIDNEVQTLYKGPSYSYYIEFMIGDQKGKMDFSPEWGADLHFNDLKITVERVSKRDTSKYAKFDGFLFYKGDEAVGAMELNDGTLWISRTALDDQGQVLLASLMTAILLEPDPEKMKRSKWGPNLSKISEKKTKKDLEKEADTRGLSRRELRDERKAKKAEEKAAKKASKKEESKQ